MSGLVVSTFGMCRRNDGDSPGQAAARRKVWALAPTARMARTATDSILSAFDG